jgi:hypothetical protein
MNSVVCYAFRPSIVGVFEGYITESVLRNISFKEHLPEGGQNRWLFIMQSIYISVYMHLLVVFFIRFPN